MKSMKGKGTTVHVNMNPRSAASHIKFSVADGNLMSIKCTDDGGKRQQILKSPAQEARVAMSGCVCVCVCVCVCLTA